MKTIIKILVVTFLLFAAYLTIQAQSVPPPPPPGGGQSGGNNVPGGGAPVHGGLGIMLLLASGYGVKKIHGVIKKTNESK